MKSYIDYIVSFFEKTSMIKLLFISFTVGGIGTFIYKFSVDFTNYILYLFQ